MGKYDNLAALARMGDEAGSAIRQYLQPSAKSSNLPAMLAARRAMIDARPGVAIDTPLVTARGGDWSAVNEADRMGLIDSGIDAIKDGKVGGLFNPSRGRFPGVGLVMYRQGDRATRRHEVMHGYTEAARMGYPGMPAVSRAAARLPNSLGVPLEEMASTRVGGGSLLTNNWPWYASYYAKQGSYGPAAVYAGLGAAQGGAVAAGAVGTAALGAAARGLLMPEESEVLDPEEVRYLTYEDPRRRLAPASVMSQDELIERLNQ